MFEKREKHLRGLSLDHCLEKLSTKQHLTLLGENEFQNGYLGLGTCILKRNLFGKSDDIIEREIILSELSENVMGEVAGDLPKESSQRFNKQVNLDGGISMSKLREGKKKNTGL